MNREDLKKVLDNEGVKPVYYSLNGIRGDQEDGTSIIEKKGSKWTYYYYERGSKFDIKYFNTEDEACRYILKILVEDPNTRIYNPPAN